MKTKECFNVHYQMSLSSVGGVAGNKTTLISRYLMWSGGNCKEITL